MELADVSITLTGDGALARSGLAEGDELSMIVGGVAGRYRIEFSTFNRDTCTQTISVVPIEESA